MLVKRIKTYRDIIAICDAELLGKKFEQGKFQLDVKESFYKGEKKTEQEVLNIMKEMAAEDAIFNIVGEKSTNTALKAGIIEKESIGKIQNIPFSLILM